MFKLNKISRISALPRIHDIEEEVGKLSILRWILGVFMSIRVLQLVYGSYFYYDSLTPFYIGLIFLLLCILFTIGLFTPLITLVLIIFWHRLDTIMNSFTLGSSMLILILSIYFISNVGGLKYSLDSLLLKKKSANFIRRLYDIIGVPSTCQIHTIYFLGFFVYAMVSFGAIMWHLNDPSWIQGTTVLELLTNSFLSKFYDLFRQIHVSFPMLFYSFSVVSVFFQSVFQILMLPLIYWKKGVLFVKFWGFIFFISSLFLIQLSYLPHIEILLWIIIFYRRNRETQVEIYYDDYCNLCKKAIRFLRFFNWNKGYLFKPLSENINFLNKYGLTRDEVQRHMHGFHKNQLYVGYDLYLKIVLANPIFIPLFPLFLLGKITRIGYFVYDRIASNRIQKFGRCEISFNANRDYNNMSYFPKAQKIRILIGSFYFTFILFICLIIFQFPIIKDFTRNLFVRYNKEIIFNRGVAFLDRTPFVMPLVFNNDDLKMGDKWAVIYRLNKHSTVMVPIVNIDGSRMNYSDMDWLYYSNHNCDILYFGNTVKYRRNFINETPENYHKIGRLGSEYLLRRMHFDYHKNHLSGTQKYRIEIYKMNKVDIFNPEYKQELIFSWYEFYKG